MKGDSVALCCMALVFAAPCFAQAPAGRRLSPCSAPGLITAGDTLKLFVFERTSSRDDDWTKSRDARPGATSFALRSDLSGDMGVGAEGFLFLPLLGAIKAAGFVPESVATTIGARFKEIFERDPMVNLTVLQRRPVFVVGYVKNPGRYDYMQGMTLMHGVAIAGGVVRPTMRPTLEAEQKYLIARQNQEGVMEQAEAEALTPLCPGDLVRIVNAEP